MNLTKIAIAVHILCKNWKYLREHKATYNTSSSSE